MSSSEWASSFSSTKDEAERRYLLRARCRTDGVLFAWVFFQHYCDKPFSELHYDMLEGFADFDRDVKQALAAPRANAKSTILSLIYPIHRIVYEEERFIVLISETEKQATDRVLEIRNELETNELLHNVYGNLVGRYWLKQDLITANDIRVMGYAVGSNIRGIRHKQWRPTLIIYDDIENRKKVKSPEMRADLLDWINKDPGRCGITGHTNHILGGTVLHIDSALNNKLSNPGWRGKVYRSVIKWPTKEANILWDEWRRIYTDLMNENRHKEADAYYKAHEERMLEGVQVLWPEGESFLALQKMIVDEGRASFNTEKQNDPINPDTSLFNMEDALYFFVENGVICREDGKFITLDSCRLFMYHDPAFGNVVDGDFGCVVMGAVDQWGYLYVLDAWIKKEPPSRQIEGAFELHAQWSNGVVRMTKAAGLETNNGWKLLKNDYQTERERRQKAGDRYDLLVIEITNTQNKDDRIGSLEPKIANRWIAFNRALPKEFMDQMRQYPTHTNDDGPDALEGLVQVARKYVRNVFGSIERSA